MSMTLKEIHEMQRLATELADAVARSAIECECQAVIADGKQWYDSADDCDEAHEVRQGITKALRYLDLRGTMQRHPTQPALVRFGA